MTTHDQTFSTAFVPSKPAGSFASWIKSIGARIATWADTCADYCAAAAIYEQLSALSDAVFDVGLLTKTHPTRGIFGCVCAEVASDHPTAAPPSSVMNSRRLT